MIVFGNKEFKTIMNTAKAIMPCSTLEDIYKYIFLEWNPDWCTARIISNWGGAEIKVKCNATEENSMRIPWIEPPKTGGVVLSYGEGEVRVETKETTIRYRIPSRETPQNIKEVLVPKKRLTSLEIAAPYLRRAARIYNNERIILDIPCDRASFLTLNSVKGKDNRRIIIPCR